MKNKFIAGMLIAVMLAGSNASTAFAKNENNDILVLNINKPTMLVNGLEKSIGSDNEVTPVLLNDTTYVPIRAIIESLGGEVQWDESESKVTVFYKDKVVQLWLDSNRAVVNGEEMTVSAAPTTMNNRTVLPLRFVSENLGLFVNWEGSTNAISISTSNDYVASASGVQIDKITYNISLGRAKNEVVNYLLKSKVIENSEGDFGNLMLNGKKIVDVIKEKGLEYARQHALLLNKARENNIYLDDYELKLHNDSITKMVQDEGGTTTAEQKTMEYYNVNLTEYTDFLKETQVVNKYISSLQTKMNVTDEEALNYFENNKADIEKVTVSHILVQTTTLSDEEARKKAEDILAKVKAGEDFAALAKQYSDDPGSKDNGGSYTFKRGEMVKEFEDWAFQAKDGDVGIVKTSYGYHVMKFVGKYTFENLKDSIKEYITNQSVKKYINDVLFNPESVAIKNQSVFDTIEIK